MRDRDGLAVALGAAHLGLEALAERRAVVQPRLAVALRLLFDEAHEARVVERDGRGVREQLEALLEVDRPVVDAPSRRDGEHADELVVVRERHGGGANERRRPSARVPREERRAFGGARDRERLVEERPHDRVGGVVERHGARELVADVGAPARADLHGLGRRVPVPELGRVGLQEGDGLLAERLLDPFDVERRRERAADLAQAVEEPVRLALLLEEAHGGDGKRDFDAERLERRKQVERQALGARAGDGAQHADGRPAERERHGEEPERLGQRRHGRPGREQRLAVLVGGGVAVEGVRTLGREVGEERFGDRELRRPARLHVHGLGAGQVARGGEPDGADVEVELRAELGHRPAQDRLDLGEARERGVQASDEGDAVVVAALAVEETRLLERAGRELRELLRQAELLRREREPAAARHREEAEDVRACVERDGHAPPPHGLRAGLVLERRAVGREAAREELVRGDRRPARARTLAAHGGAVREDLRDLLRLGLEPERAHAVELQLARERRHGQADDLVGVQRGERPRRELEERDGFLAALHERSERAVPLENVADRPREFPRGLLGLGVRSGDRLEDDAEDGLRLVLDLHGRAEERETALGRLLGAALGEDLGKMLVEPRLGRGGDAGAPRARHRWDARAGQKRDDRRVEEVQGRVQDPAERLVEEQALLERSFERLQEWEAGKAGGRHGGERP